MYVLNLCLIHVYSPQTINIENFQIIVFWDICSLSQVLKPLKLHQMQLSLAKRLVTLGNN